MTEQIAETADSGRSTPHPKPSLGTKLAYGVGSAAYGAKDSGLKYFLLLFYSQVVGVDSRLVSLAILIALVCDAISDPLVGYWSDNFRSRWGRRHPFMYAAAVPVSVSFYAMWNPPMDWDEGSLFWYILVCAVVVRTFITFYETPSTALAPELSRDYDERSKILGFRYFFGWSGGNMLTVATFIVIFPAFATAAYPNGQFNPEAYQVFGLAGSVVIFSAILISAVGTHHTIPTLTVPPKRQKIGIGGVFREMYQAVSSKSFFALFAAALVGMIASGLTAGLTFYLFTYFWDFTSQQTGLLTFGVFFSAIIGSTMAPIVTRKLGKQRAAIIIGIIAFGAGPLPVVLRLFDLMPENGDPILFWIVFIAQTIDVGLIVCFQILSSSMMADLVEQSEVKTGKRAEGVFFAAGTFIRKCGEGFGIVAAGFVLSGIGFAAGAQQGEVSDETVWLLGATYVPLVWLLFALVIAIITFYDVDRGKHEKALRDLAQRDQAQSDQTTRAQRNPAE